MNQKEFTSVLQTCSLHSLLLVTSKMLARSGYGDVQILDRRETKQKSRFGGHELLCESTLGTVPIKVIVKVISDSIRLRMLDELAGAVLRTNSDLGIIVSPYPLSNRVARHKESYNAARITVIYGDGLATRLTTFGIGVRPHGGVDYQFFAHLEDIGSRARTFIQMEGAR
jgi:hypothetical protein